jgi:hypothetical protein
MSDGKYPDLCATRLAAVFWRVCLCFRQRNNVRLGRREIDELGHAGGMLVAQMAVNFHGQRAAVFVARLRVGRFGAASPMIPVTACPACWCGTKLKALFRQSSAGGGF